MELRGSKPASIVTRDDEWQAADKLDEVFNDETMTRYYLENRYSELHY